MQHEAKADNNNIDANEADEAKGQVVTKGCNGKGQLANKAEDQQW